MQLRNDNFENRLVNGKLNQCISKSNGKLGRKSSQSGNSQFTKDNSSVARHSSENKSKSRTLPNPVSSPPLDQNNCNLFSKKDVDKSQHLTKQSQPKFHSPKESVASSFRRNSSESSLIRIKPSKLKLINQTSSLISAKNSLLDNRISYNDEKTYQLKLVMSSTDAFKHARGVNKSEKKLAIIKKQYYQKAISIMVVGGLLFITGVIFAALYFSGIMIKYQIAGPICLAVGLLMTICGFVWLPIIKTKLKRREQLMTPIFSL